jgi:hypothetical protein
MTLTLEERVRKARSHLALVLAGLSSDQWDEDMSTVSRQDMLEALFDAAESAYGELYWLSLLPGELLNTAAPDDDERADAEKGGA